MFQAAVSHLFLNRRPKKARGQTRLDVHAAQSHEMTLSHEPWGHFGSEPTLKCCSNGVTKTRNLQIRARDVSASSRWRTQCACV